MQTLYDLVLSNILKEMQKQNKSQKELTDYLDVSKSTFTDWKSGKSKSFMKHLPQIAEFFQVSVDFLTDKKNKAIPEGQPLSEEIKTIIHKCKQLSDEKLQKVIEYVDLLELKSNAENGSKETIRLVARSGEQKEIIKSKKELEELSSQLKEDTTSDY